MGYYNSIADYQKHLTTMTTEMKKVIRNTLGEVGTYATVKIREKYGVKQPGGPESRFNDTPLRKTGKLANSVGIRQISTTQGYVEVGVKQPMIKIGQIHEVGATFKMTDKQRKYLFAVVFKDLPRQPSTSKNPGYITIPARPIRRNIPKDAAIHAGVKNILEQGLKRIFNK